MKFDLAFLGYVNCADLDDPVGVPVVELAEATAGRDEVVGYVQQREALGLVADLKRWNLTRLSRRARSLLTMTRLSEHIVCKNVSRPYHGTDLPAQLLPDGIELVGELLHLRVGDSFERGRRRLPVGNLASKKGINDWLCGSLEAYSFELLFQCIRASVFTVVTTPTLHIDDRL